MRFLETDKEIKNVINDEDVKVVQLIMSEVQDDEICMVVGTRMFSSPYLIPYNKKQFVYDELWDTKVVLFLFTDNELTEAWKQSYLDGGIEEERWDRRTVFHPYNEMNEMFCIDPFLLEDITGERRGGDETLPNWKKGIINWYRTKMII